MALSDELDKLAAMRSAGTLTEEEFRRAKERRVRGTEAAGKMRLLRGRERTDESAGAQTT